MNLILASQADSAALNLRERLLELGNWREDGEFQGSPVWRLVDGGGSFCAPDTHMATLAELHLHAENIDREWAAQFGESPECIAFLSRHKAASGRPSLTVHPVGNWGGADCGGTPGAVSGTAPGWMTGLLLAIPRTMTIVGAGAVGAEYACIFATLGTDLRGPVRAGASDDELWDFIAGVWGRRVDRYSEERTELAPLENAPSKVEMYQIGG